MALDTEQRGVARGMGAGMLLTFIVLGAGSLLPPLALPASDAVADRLAFVLKADLGVVFWLIAAIGAVAKDRFFSPTDIAGSAFGEPGQKIAIGRAIVQNTHEQATLAVMVHLALGVALPMSLMGLIPLLVALFGIGRAAFWMGYAGGAASRAFGFEATFFPTVLGALTAAVLAAVG